MQILKAIKYFDSKENVVYFIILPNRDKISFSLRYIPREVYPVFTFLFGI